MVERELSVLWLEDDDWFFEKMARTLAKYAKLAFLHARTKQDAHRIVRRTPVDRIVVDVCLGLHGDVSGIEFLEELRCEGNQTPAVALSGELTLERSYRLKTLGAADFVKAGLDDPRSLARVIQRGGIESILARPGLARTDPFEQVADDMEGLPGVYAKNVDRVEAIVIVRARDSEPSLTAAAKKLGWHRQTLAEKLKKL
jgi:DNA-binding NtrC family response regulator